MLDIKTEIKSAFLENKIAIYISILLLIGTLIAGYLLQPYLQSIFDPVVNKLTNDVKTGVITLTFQTIFINNIFIVFRMFVFGIFFCFSGIILAYNGFFVGYYVASSPNFFKVLMYIIPHGIFEFSSCILATAAGFVLFHFLFKFIYNISKPDLDYINSKNNFYNLTFRDKIMYSIDKNYVKLKQSLILLGIAVVLMAIAGVVEVYITVPFANFILSIFG
ncbi:stage II sporulation protein M [uncultured Methanobrevibacter sp.]|uniref:stage II sporulation protein M n=1 Tax=uncultured Methanobrevibacter sp. TaxID=253161 RepID=UPI00263112AC|nr:stage II sporulation protein M [uncultured Methanobrevibacter sp.]